MPDHTPPPDPRLHPWRPDLAADFLRGMVSAGRYVSGEARQSVRGISAIRRRPARDSERMTTLLYGQGFTVYDARDGWAWGQSAHDGYCGYVQESGLTRHLTEATHVVDALSAPVLPAASVRSAPVSDILYLGTPVTIVAEEGDFAGLAAGGWVFRRHLATVGAWRGDWVATAESFIGAPYLWGGMTVRGFDCSGLVAAALNRAGRVVPRDSDMQMAALGEPLADLPAPDALRRGDLLFWTGHVAVATGPDRVVHATVPSVIGESATGLIDRLAGQGLPLLAVRRLSSP
ncbi:MAG: NlpC/P60 family protein [Alphaproteobacteria bacterium]